MGDFNQVVNLKDKEGGRGVDYDLMIEFREVLDKCDLQEISFEGDRFTWDNGRKGEDFIQERLDLGFANESFLQMFPEIRANHMDRDGSNHSPIVFSCSAVRFNKKEKKGPRPFRFESAWLDDAQCLEVIDNGWRNPGSGSAEAGIMGKISRCASDLKEWEWSHFGNITRDLSKARQKLVDLQQ